MAVGYSTSPGRGTDFCAQCAMPGPWVSRDKLIQWIRHQLQADATMPGATRHELIAAMDRLQGMASDDTKAIPGWQQIREAAPKVWELSKPVLVNILSEELKRRLGLSS